MNPMYKEAGRKIAEGKVCWATLIGSKHYHCELETNRYGMVMRKIQTLTLQGITVQIYENPRPYGLHLTNHKAYHMWEQLVAEGNVG